MQDLIKQMRDAAEGNEMIALRDLCSAENVLELLDKMDMVMEVNGVLHFSLREAFADIELERGSPPYDRASLLKRADEGITQEIQETAKQRAAHGMETRILPMLLRLGRLEMALKQIQGYTETYDCEFCGTHDIARKALEDS